MKKYAIAASAALIVAGLSGCGDTEPAAKTETTEVVNETAAPVSETDQGAGDETATDPGAGDETATKQGSTDQGATEQGSTDQGTAEK